MSTPVIDSEQAEKRYILASLRRKLRAYEPDIADWIMNIYIEYGERADKLFKALLRQDCLYTLMYTRQDFAEFTVAFLREYGKRLPCIAVDTEMLSLFIKNSHELLHSRYSDFDDYEKLGSSMITWMEVVYDRYGVSLLYFAFKYAIDFHNKNIEHRFDRASGRTETLRDYDCTAVWENLFDIDHLYDKIKHIPFIAGHKKDIEALIMYFWLHSLYGGEEYWPVYVERFRNEA